MLLLCDISVEHSPGLHSYSIRTTVHISTTGQQLAVIGTLPRLSWERSESAFSHDRLPFPPIRELSPHGAGAGEVYLTATLSLDQKGFWRSFFFSSLFSSSLPLSLAPSLATNVLLLVDFKWESSVKDPN